MREPLPRDEETRLCTLNSLRVLDSLPEVEFDDIVAAAAALLEVPIALVSLVARDRQWFKAKTGIELCETSREISFCAHAILQSEPLVIPDATQDPRFSDNDLVAGEFHLRFYAGVPIVVMGQPVGTLCCIDHKPRNVSESQLRGLTALSRTAAALLSARQAESRLAASELRFSMFMDNLPVTVLLRDAAGQIRYVNREFERMFGRSAQSVVGLTYPEWLPSQVADKVLRDEAEVRDSGAPHESIVSFPNAATSRACICRLIKFPMQMEVELWIGTAFVDLTRLQETEDKVRAQARLLSNQNKVLLKAGKEVTEALDVAHRLEISARLSAIRFRQLFEKLPVACYAYDRNGIICEWNEQAEQLWAKPALQAIQESIYKTVIAASNRAKHETIVRRVFAGQASIGVESRETLGDGSERWLLSNTIPVHDIEGAVVTAVSASVDITQIKFAESRLREQEERFQSILKSLGASTHLPSALAAEA